jgi:2-polyprenyl-3-methyl-5-hydroxy-6-metoxy-1,4-benzoquinol methylase
MEFERIADRKRLTFIIQTLKEKLPAGAEVLDVGCGNGVISRNLGAAGFKVKGVDVSEKTIEKARQLNTFPNVVFEVKSAEQIQAVGQLYHAIICSEVLEHLNQPDQLLHTLNNLLTDDGVLIVTVPNGKGPRELFVTRPIIKLREKDNFLWKGVQHLKSLLGYKGTTVQSDADDLTHIQFFTKKSLIHLAESTNFNIVKFGKTNFVEDVFPFSFLTKRFKLLQEWDCKLAEQLPYQFTGGFVTVWSKINKP